VGVLCFCSLTMSVCSQSATDTPQRQLLLCVMWCTSVCVCHMVNDDMLLSLCIFVLSITAYFCILKYKASYLLTYLLTLNYFCISVNSLALRFCCHLVIKSCIFLYRVILTFIACRCLHMCGFLCSNN